MPTPPDTPRPRVLVADDQADVVEAVRLLLKLEGYEVDGVGSPGAVLAAVERGGHDVALIDLNYARDTTSGAEGLDLLSQLRVASRELGQTIVMVTHDAGAAAYADRALLINDGRLVGDLDHPDAASIQVELTHAGV